MLLEVTNSKIKPFLELKDIEKFKRFKVNYTLEWENDLDIAPEYVYFRAFKDDKSMQDIFTQWGYVANM